jgi:hypothetical protein
MDEQITISKAQFIKLLEAAHCAHKDAFMALRDEWDRTDDGFEDQIHLLGAALEPFESLLDEPLESL